MAVALAANGVSKFFGSTRALDGVSLELVGGEVVALMGANGAGKSTLVKVLCGIHGTDAGTISVGGKTVIATSPRRARAHGIVAVHQSIADVGVGALSVADNLLLDRYCAGGGPILAGGRRYRAAAEVMADEVGLRIDLNRRLDSISIAERQLVAIARGVAYDPAVLIFDEPTASLSQPESERLFGVIEALKNRGVAVLYISHKIGDLRRLADRVVVLRDGRVAGAFSQPIDFSEAIQAMIGRKISRGARTGKARPEEALLRISGGRLNDVSAPFELTAHAGEIVAVTGPVGAGKSTLAGALFGLWPLADGSIELDGKPWKPASAGDSIRNGVFLAGEDRWRTTFFPPSVPFANVAGTISFPFLSRWSKAGLVPRAAEERAANTLIREFGIRTRGSSDVLTALSGGNQQKVVLARWHAEPARLLLLDEPFQGVDIGARNDIIAAIRAKSEGRATIVFVNDLEEAFEVADRVVVMIDHTIVGDAEDRLDEAAELLGSLPVKTAH